MELFWRVSGCLVLIAAMTAADAQAAWWSLGAPATFAGVGGRVEASVLTIDLAAASVRVLSVPFEMRRLAQLEGPVSLREFAEQLARDPRYKPRDWIAVNGGFSSYRVDVPLGLLVVGGKVYSTPNATTVPQRSSCRQSEFGRFRWSGILCHHKETGAWEIISPPKYTTGLCGQALQAGPTLIEPDFTVSICPGETAATQPSSRTVVCLAAHETMKIVVTKPTHLYPLAQWLAKPVAAGGLECRVALNLSGDSSSGIAIHSPSAGGITYVGDGSYPIPSVLVLEGRETAGAATKRQR